MKLRLPGRVDRATVLIATGAVLLAAAYIGVATWVSGYYDAAVPSASVYSTSPQGSSIWFAYLGDLGIAPRALTTFTGLPRASTIVIAGPLENEPGPQDPKTLADWVRSGGRVVLVGTSVGALSGSLGPVTPVTSGADTTSLVPELPGAYADGVSTIEAGPGRIDPGGSVWATVYGDDTGAVLLVRTLGKGEVVWLADSAAVSNDRVGDADNGALAVALADRPGMPVYFDEYHHGIVEDAGLWGALGSGGQAAVWLLLAGVAVLVFALGRRLGPAIAEPAVPEARGGAYIGQLARIYRLAGARAEALSSLEDGLTRSLVKRYGSRRVGEARQPRAAQALGDSAALRSRGKLGRDEFTQAAARLRRVRNEVEGAKMGDPTAIRTLATNVANEVGKAVVGQDEAVESLLIGLVTGGHVLLEGVPGTAKTLMARCLAFCLDASFKRIQFSPDLMPSDVVGTTIYDAESGTFRLRMGPIFANLVLADEINRTPPKTQAALLEAMQEGQVTIDGIGHPLPQPFMVVATQNPVEYEGTYPLPEAQLDRFQQKVVIDYLDEASEVEVLSRHLSGLEMADLATFGMRPVATVGDVLAARATLADVVVDDGVVRYTAAIARATRDHTSVFLGASPRAGVSLLVASKAHAMLSGRDFVTPDDVKSMAGRCLRHRIILRPEVEIEGVGADSVLSDVLDSVPVPR